jgi:hypothetical protein
MDSQSKTYTIAELRHEFMNKLHDNAHDWANRPDLSPLERCHGAVFGTLSVIDGVNGNGPDGQGLPLFQLMPSPHPDYNEAREKAGLPTVPNHLPLDHIENEADRPEYGTQLRYEYATLYDTMKDELSRGAASLFS